MPRLMSLDDGATIAVILNGTTAWFFDHQGGGTYSLRFPGTETLTYNSGSDTFTLSTGSGDQVVFAGFSLSRPWNRWGQFEQMSTAGGAVVAVTEWTTDGQIAEVQTTSGSLIESYLYTYVSGGVNEGRLESVTLRRSQNGGTDWSTINSVEYEYYDGVEDYGNAGDLKLVTLKDATGTTVSVEYYRYYTPGDSNGYVGGLRYAVLGASYDRLIAAHGSTLSAITDGNLSSYADYYFEYDSERRITKEIAAGAGCSVCGGGLGSLEYSFTASSNSPGYNSWATKTVETLPDGNQNTVYTNAYGQVILKAFKEIATGNEWINYYRYDSAGRLLLHAAPSAVSGYDDGYEDLVNFVAGNAQYLTDAVGLFTVYTYYSSTSATSSTPGGVLGYIESQAVRSGELGTDVPQTLTTYIERTAGGATVYPIAEQTVYSGTGSVGPLTTSYAYTWHAGTTQAASVVTTLPTVLTTSNGSGSATTVEIVFDTNGRPIWSRDAGGYLTYLEYDPLTGAVVKTIADVDTTESSDFANLPSGWSTPIGGGVHEITLAEVDHLGRVTKVTHPDGSIDYTVYDDANHEVRYYIGWNAGAPAGPTVVVREDRANGYSETLTMTATPAVDGTGRPTGTEAIAGVVSLSRAYVNDAGQVVHQDDYFDLTGLTYTTAATLGTQGVHFLRTQFGYDKQGLPNRTVTPDGVIYRTVYDGLGRPVSEWVGDNDTPTSGYWSPTNAADMQLVREYEYDDGGVGDGNLTLLTEYPGGGADPRVTQTWYDWRNRPVVIKQGVETTESTSLNRPLTYLEYDNLGRVTAATVYDGDGVTPVDANSDGVPDAPSQSLRRGRTETVYDQRGQVAQTKVFGADAATGDLAFTPYVTDFFYDARGLLAKTVLPGGMVEKVSYDGLGRPTVSYITDGGADANYADALTVTGDLVLTQTEYAYDAVGNLIQVTNRERVHGETGTGELGDLTTGVAARVSFAGMYYDAIGRVTDTVDVGTNGGTTWTRPSTVPTRSDAELVTSYGYDAAGNLATVTDPLGIVSQTAYDALGRITSETMAYGTVDAFTMAYAYDTAGRLLSITRPGSRETRFGYDDLGRQDEVIEHYGTAFERSSTTLYNLLGEVTSTTDAVGAVTAVGYDVLGRLVSVTEAVGDTLERVTTTAHDTLGRVIAITDPRGYTTSYVFDDVARTSAVVDPYGNDWVTTTDLGGRVTAITDPLGKSTTSSYDVWGRLTSMSDALSNTTKFEYTVSGDRDAVIDPNSNRTETVYDDFGRMAEVIDAHSNSSEYEYDRSGRLVIVTDPRGTPTEYEYDFLGRVRIVTEAVGFTEERESSYDYDSNGDLVTMTDPRGTITKYVYDAAGRASTVTAAYGLSEAQTTSFLYDDLDRTISVTAPGGLVTESEYDLLGRLTEVTEGVGTLLARTTAYGYDGNDNLITITDPLSNTTTYGYDKRNLMVSITDAESGVTTMGYDERGSKISLIDPVLNEIEWGYDDAGRLTSETDPLGKTTSYAYDAAGNLVSIRDRLGLVRVFTVDDLNRVTAEDWYASLGGTKLQSQTFSYDANGNLLTATDPDGSYTFTYDRLNRPVTVDGPFLDFTFAYDDNGNRTSVTDSTGAVETSSYDVLNRLTSRELGGTGVTPLKAEWSYDAAGLVETLERFGWSGSVWVSAGVTDYTYDDLNRVTGIRHADASDNTLGEYTYSYDLANRLTGQTIDGDSRTFDYDDTNQITDDDGTSYSYDANGNRTNSGYVTDDGNRLSTDGVWTYTYDDAGRMVGKSKTGESWSYEYDLRGQLVAVEQRDGSNALLARVEYIYDAFGNRIGRTEYDGTLTVVSDERYAVDGWNPAKPIAVGSENFDVVADLAPDGLGGWTVDVRRTFGDGFDELVAKDDGSAVSWYGADRQGSVRVVFDNAGTELAELDYDAFGGLLSGVRVDRYGYAGREWDETLGLQYNRGRMYDPATGRWTSEDPIGIAGGDPNYHRYVGNSPMNATDPSGLDSDPIYNGPYGTMLWIYHGVAGTPSYISPPTSAPPPPPPSVRANLPTTYSRLTPSQRSFVDSSGFSSRFPSDQQQQQILIDMINSNARNDSEVINYTGYLTTQYTQWHQNPYNLLVLPGTVVHTAIAEGTTPGGSQLQIGLAGLNMEGLTSSECQDLNMNLYQGSLILGVQILGPLIPGPGEMSPLGTPSGRNPFFITRKSSRTPESTLYPPGSTSPWFPPGSTSSWFPPGSTSPWAPTLRPSNTGRVGLQVKPAKFGPFWRTEPNAGTIGVIEQSGELIGYPRGNMYNGVIPEVRAYPGELPAHIKGGFEFYTELEPKFVTQFGSDQAVWRGDAWTECTSIRVIITKKQ